MAPNSPQAPINLAFNRPAIASSEERAGLEAGKAVDDNLTTYWSTTQRHDPEWIYVDLGRVQHVAQVVLRWEVHAETYHVDFSVNGVDWTTVLQLEAMNGGVDVLDVSGDARFVRVYGTTRGSSGFGYALREFEVYDQPAYTAPVIPPKPSAPTPPSNTLFFDDFEDGPDPRWQFLGNNWRVVDGYFEIDDPCSGDYTGAVVGDAGWRDYELQFDLRGMAGAGRSFLVRYGGIGNSYLLTSRHLENDLVVEWPGATQFAGYAFDLGRWYRVRIRAEGDRLRAWVDDQLVYDQANSSGPRTGGIGAFVNAGPVNCPGHWVGQYDNFLVTDLSAPSCYALTVSQAGTGASPAITPANSPGCPAGHFIPGQTITLTAAPAAGWQVTGWTGTTADGSQALTNTVSMPAGDHTAAVNYSLIPPPCYLLTVTHTGHGANPMVTPTQSPGCATNQFHAGAAITLTAAPDAGWRVTGWSGSSADGNTATTNTVIMPARPHTAGVIYGVLPPECYTLTLAHTGEGANPVPNPDRAPGCPAGRFAAAAQVTLTASPSPGWRVVSWSGTQANAATVNTNTVVMPAAHHTATVTYASVSSVGDTYETDDTCDVAQWISTDGATQPHNFHRPGDVDWLRFEVVAGARYRIAVQTPPGSLADVALELYPNCDSLPATAWHATFTPDVRLEFDPTFTGTVYVAIANDGAPANLLQTTYEASVQRLEAEQQVSSVILVAGRLRNSDPLQANIHQVAGAFYQLLQAYFHTSEDIYFLATDSRLVGYDAAATANNLRLAITQWAANRLGEGDTLTLLLIDHGEVGKLYLDGANGQFITPAQLDQWLGELETAVPGVKINVIVEACYSGSFIQNAQSISRGNRVVVASTDNKRVAYASTTGAHFSDHLITALRQGLNLFASWAQARRIVQQLHEYQQPWLDANGNQVPNEEADFVVARGRSLANGTMDTEHVWPPFIVPASVTITVEGEVGTIVAEVRDNLAVEDVWATIYPPGYTPPADGRELIAENVTTVRLDSAGDDRYVARDRAFATAGLYRIVLHAEDGEQLQSVPVVAQLEVRTDGIFLPFAAR